MSGSTMTPRRRAFLVVTCGVLGMLLALGLFLSELFVLAQANPQASRDIVIQWLLRFLLDGIAGVIALVLLWQLSGRYSLARGLTIIGLTAVSSFAVPASAYAIVSIAARKSPRPLIAAFLVYAAATAFGLWVFPTMEPPVPLPVLLLTGVAVFSIPVLIGFNLRSRHEIRLSQVREAESRVRNAVLMEQARLAREIHDSVAHQLSLISLHAGVLESRPDLSPAQVRKEATIVGEAARAVTDDVRGILTVLRNEPTTESPPDADTIPDMLATLSQAGNPINVSGLEELTNASLTTSHSQQVFRIAQEAATNALKHGAPGSAHMSFSVAEGYLRIVCENTVGESVNTGGGAGLIGMHERVSLLDGTMKVTNTGDRFRLKVSVPCS